ncbi:hypothetical protein [Streptomyces lydicus]
MAGPCTAGSARASPSLDDQAAAEQQRQDAKARRLDQRRRATLLRLTGVS